MNKEEATNKIVRVNITMFLMIGLVWRGIIWITYHFDREPHTTDLCVGGGFESLVEEIEQM